VLHGGTVVETLVGDDCTAANITRACFDRGGLEGDRVGTA
jgi:hypothetical protein